MFDCTATIVRSVLLMLPLLAVSAAKDDPITRCALAGTEHERILCLEEALRQSNGGTTIGSNAKREPSVDQPMPATRDAADSVARSELERDQFGLKEESTANDRAAAIDVTIVATTKNAYGKSVYITENGQEWQQTDQKTLRIRELPVAATIRTATAGSFFLRAKEGGVAVRVKRRK